MFMKTGNHKNVFIAMATLLAAMSVSSVKCAEPEQNAKPQSTNDSRAAKRQATNLEQDPNRQPTNICRIICLQPDITNPEASVVLDTLEKLAKSYGEGDMVTYAKFVDDGCTTFDNATGRMVSGKAAHLKCMEDALAKSRKLYGESPVVSYTLEQPYARIKGDVATVTFRAIEQVGGNFNEKLQADATNLFIKRDNEWKLFHCRIKWKKVG
jgi:hypothetical protein